MAWTPQLPSAEHPWLQGPGLVVINDGRFEPAKDGRAIRRFGLNNKAADATSIGKFGLGLKSVFHLAEVFFLIAEDERGAVLDADVLKKLMLTENPALRDAAFLTLETPHREGRGGPSVNVRRSVRNPGIRTNIELLGMTSGGGSNGETCGAGRPSRPNSRWLVRCGPPWRLCSRVGSPRGLPVGHHRQRHVARRRTPHRQ
jgi:hypothetical protein